MGPNSGRQGEQVDPWCQEGPRGKRLAKRLKKERKGERDGTELAEEKKSRASPVERGSYTGEGQEIQPFFREQFSNVPTEKKNSRLTTSWDKLESLGRSGEASIETLENLGD